MKAHAIATRFGSSLVKVGAVDLTEMQAGPDAHAAIEIEVVESPPASSAPPAKKRKQ